LNTGPERYQEWWKKFVGAVTLGPILTFFLWLGLAAASSGSLAATEKFTLQQSSDSVGIYTEVFEVEKLTSLFIGLVLISTGLQVASGAAGALGGIAGKLVSEQTGTAGLKMALGAPAAVGARLGRAGAAGARFGARQVERRTGVGRGVGRGIIGAGAELRARGGLLGGLAGAALVKAGGGIERTAAESVKLAKGAAKERVAGMGLSEKVATLRSTDPEAKRLTAWSQSEIDKAGEATKEFVSDRSLQRQVRGDLERSMGETAGRKEFDNIMERSMRFMQRPEVQAELTDSERRNLLKTQTEHLDKVNVYDEAGEVDTAKTREAKKKIIEDAEFSNRNLSEAAIRDSDVQELLEGKVVRAYTDAKTGERVSVSAMDEVRKGIGVTREVTEAARGAGATFAESPAKMIEAALQNGYLKVEKLRPEDIRDKAGNIVPGRVEAFTRGAIQSEVDLSTMPTAVQSDFAKEADRQYKATTDPVEQRRIDRAEFSRTGQPSRIGIEADGRIRRGQHLTVREEISQRPESIVNLKVQVREGVRKGGNDVTKAITDNLKSADLEGLLKKYTEATTAEAQVDLRDAVWQVASAVESEMVRAKGAPSADLKKLRQKTSLVLGEMD
ncbi:hypothetical protein IH979_02710, partial [Patescibacteria group bacterium]|nr:hypothetical protein [Patescibacteria group bacterium]